MKRRLFLLGLTTSLALAASTGAVLASSFSEDVVAQLVKLGFSDITAETTLLGRVRILAKRSDGVREIVLNPRTGEVLRDTWLPTAGGNAPRTVLNDIDDGENGGDDSGGDDSGGDDSGGDDNSGSGSGKDDSDDDHDDNSGHGSGGDDDKNDDRADDREDNRDDKRDENKRN